MGSKVFIFSQAWFQRCIYTITSSLPLKNLEQLRTYELFAILCSCMPQCIWFLTIRSRAVHATLRRDGFVLCQSRLLIHQASPSPEKAWLLETSQSPYSYSPGLLFSPRRPGPAKLATPQVYSVNAPVQAFSVSTCNHKYSVTVFHKRTTTIQAGYQ